MTNPIVLPNWFLRDVLLCTILLGTLSGFTRKARVVGEVGSPSVIGVRDLVNYSNISAPSTVRCRVLDRYSDE